MVAECPAEYIARPMNRRDLLQSVAAASIATAGGFFVAETPVSAADKRYTDVFPQLDRYVEQFMREMNAPGMTLVLADRDAVLRVASYGLGNLEARTAVKPGELFQIGSISKSVVGLCLMQLRDEGKLDLQRPIVEYLPWFKIESAFAPITVHHLLAHSSGLPSSWEPFLSDPSQRHRAAHAPGEHFHYNNMAWATLGHLAETLDGRELPAIIRARVLEPLEMTESEPVITLEVRDRFVKNYAAFQNDRPLPRKGRLCEAPAIVITSGAGCVASTGRDMGNYIRMIANRGVGPRGRLISEESFALFSSSHVKVEEGATAGYGYGLFVDQLDGHPLLRHTGGMVSFMSSMMIEMDHGIAAFASINAQQGYRPSPVVQYALQLLGASRDGKALTPLPAANSPTSVENAADYAGRFKSADRSLEIVAETGNLFLVHQGTRVALEKSDSPDRFVVMHRDFDRYLLVFGRSDANDPKSPVVEVAWGPDWYTNAAYTGPKEFEYPKEWAPYLGHYRNESPWAGSIRIVARKGQLFADGVTPLEPAAGDVFYFRDEPHSPEWISFGEVINGRCMRIKISGGDAWRVAAA